VAVDIEDRHEEERDLLEGAGRCLAFQDLAEREDPASLPSISPA